MELPSDILNHIRCPQCQGVLHFTKEKVLFCLTCRVCYPVNDGVPDLSPESAMPVTPEGKVVSKYPIAHFRVETGAEEGLEFSLDQGTCKVIGRRLDDNADTRILTDYLTMPLDDHSKKLIQNYVSRTAGKKKAIGPSEDDPSQLGSYRRMSDLILSDAGVSRLHAMIFHDSSGVGVLDLVSRNGTYISGREVEAAFMKVGDVLKVGSTKIRFSVDS